ncbi:uncharacterized protein cubi_00426 [Cryptosporidium ubiquitum]|uniref:Uncharacterized protein n=1 Tax=Cryptosporidium ubiquitum TaxID=857276 RepID=A0A1J4MEL5_9CRYT|nr:uncharacterized protein cubi_00426 [Cryptosporidium ubiquitum]OII72431.1 hypothetical protein cubi_00426 [Cryptosporidium ubiquitum]
MVLVGDFNKEIIGLFKTKYPTEKEKLLELNLSSISRNPSFNCNLSSLYGGKNGNKPKCCEEGNACCGEDNKNSDKNNKLFTLDGSSTLKWDMFSTQMETKIDMNGIAIMEAKTTPYYGLSLTSKYERFSKGLSSSSSGSGSLEIGGDIQKEYFQSRFRVSPSLESLGCVNKLNKENKDSIGMMLSNTITMKPFSCINSLSFGTMISSSNVNLPYNKNSIKIVMGLMLKGPLFVRKTLKECELSQKGGGNYYNYHSLNHKKENFGSRFKSGINYNDHENTIKEETSSSFTPNYILSIQTNTNNHNNKLSGFTGGLFLNNLLKNYLTLGVMVSYNAALNNGGNYQTVNNIIEHNTVMSNNQINSLNESSKAYKSFATFSEKVQYTIGGKVSFGSIDNYCLFGKKLNLDSEYNGSSNTDDNLKSTDLRFKIMNNFKMAYSLTHRFTRNISATFGAQVDPKKLDNPDSVKYGFILDINA